MLRHLLIHPVVDVVDEFSTPTVDLRHHERITHLRTTAVQLRQGARGAQQDPILESASLESAQQLRCGGQHLGNRHCHRRTPNTPECTVDRTNMLISGFRYTGLRSVVTTRLAGIMLLHMQERKIASALVGAL